MKLVTPKTISSVVRLKTRDDGGGKEETIGKKFHESITRANQEFWGGKVK